MDEMGETVEILYYLDSFHLDFLRVKISNLVVTCKVIDCFVITKSFLCFGNTSQRIRPLSGTLDLV